MSRQRKPKVLWFILLDLEMKKPNRLEWLFRI